MIRQQVAHHLLGKTTKYMDSHCFLLFIIFSAKNTLLICL